MSGGGSQLLPLPPPLEPEAKRQRVATSASTLAGCTIFVPAQGLPHGAKVFSLWQRSVTLLGGKVTKDAGCAGITHAIVPPGARGWACLPAMLQPGSSSALVGLHYVTQLWLTESLRKQQRQPEAAHVAPQQPAPAPTPAPVSAGHTSPPAPPLAATGAEESVSAAEMEARKAWLGPLWRPECASMNQVELSLQGDYDEERCWLLGNEHVVQALREMGKYELALNGPLLKDARGASVSNHKFLAYARGAAAVRTCAYRLQHPVAPGQLPWLGNSTMAEVNEILLTGTCKKLEHFRRDEPVRDSKGALREDSAGAATRRKFTALLGVGAGIARQWWDRGFRTYEDVEAAVAGRGPGPKLAMRLENSFGLRHRQDLLEGPSLADLEEMRQAVLAALVELTGVTGWQIEAVGGSGRHKPAHLQQLRQHPAAQAQQQEQQPTIIGTTCNDSSVPGANGGNISAVGGGSMPSGTIGSISSASSAPPGPHAAGNGGGSSTSGAPQMHHDADLMVSHPTATWNSSLIEQLRDLLLLRCRLLPPETGAMCRIQRGRTRDLEAKLLLDMTSEADEQFSNFAGDRLDKLFAVFRTSGGKLRRMDVILAVPEQLPYAMIGWIGSTQYNRFLRHYANHLGMHLNSHGLYRMKQGRLCRVPEDAPPLNRQLREWWPPGWQPDSSAAGGEGAAAEGATCGTGEAGGQACAAPAAAPAAGGPASNAAAAPAAAGSPSSSNSGDKWGAGASGCRRRVRTQRDVFELLGLPYREPWQRNCP